MRQIKQTLAATILFATLFVRPARGQTPATVVIDVQDVVEYQADTADPTKFGINPNITPPSPLRNFTTATIIGDIVAVNGQPAKGLYAGRSRAVVASRTPNPGGAIADLNRSAMGEAILEILKPDGTAIGTIMGSGFSAGPVPPGLPADQRGNWAITGAPEHFLGRGGR